MLPLSTKIRVFIHRYVTDMRKSFDGLHAIVNYEFNQSILSGDLFVFFNRTRDRRKILLWDRDGLVVWAKRLERGTFQRPAAGNALADSPAAIEVDATMLSLILSGVDLASAQRRKRYSPVS
jgi:transposase